MAGDGLSDGDGDLHRDVILYGKGGLGRTALAVGSDKAIVACGEALKVKYVTYLLALISTANLGEGACVSIAITAFKSCVISSVICIWGSNMGNIFCPSFDG